MNSKEIIQRVIEHNAPPRIGFSFNPPAASDISVNYGGLRLKVNPDQGFQEWGRYPELCRQVPDFTGQLCLREGNIYGRLNEKTKGECVKGALEDGWEALDSYMEKYMVPSMDKMNYDLESLESWAIQEKDKFLLIPVTSLQAQARDARKMDNMLMDTVLETESLKKMVSACADLACCQIDILAEHNIDAAIVSDDWGLQTSLYINPVSWRDIWKPEYDRVVRKCHARDMKFMLHSCGNIADLFDDFLDIGVDVLQLDQPALFGYETLAAKLKNKITVWSPVDIQKYLPTGDKELIQSEAAKMVECLHCNGGFIAKDYPTPEDIDVSVEWASYAHDVFINYKY